MTTAAKGRRLGLVAAVAGGIVIGVIGSGTALAVMEVRDSANLTQNAKAAAEAVKQVKELGNILKEAENIFGAIGRAKSTVNVSVPNWNTTVTSTVKAANPNFDNWQLPKDVAPNVGSPTKAVEFLAKALDTPKAEPGKEAKPHSIATLKKIQDNRRRAQREISIRALGTAQNALASASTASDTANSILNAPNSDLREQIALLTQATVGVHQELIQMRVLLASTLELQAANTINALPTTTMEAGADQATAGTDEDGTENPFAN
jgi:hypothetical protein